MNSYQTSDNISICPFNLKGSCRNKTFVKDGITYCNFRGEYKTHLTLLEKNTNQKVKSCGNFCYHPYLHDPIKCIESSTSNPCEDCLYGSCKYKDSCQRRHDATFRYKNHILKTTVMCPKFGKEYCNESTCKFGHFNKCPIELNNKVCIDINCKYNHNILEIINKPLNEEETEKYPILCKLINSNNKNIFSENWDTVVKKNLSPINIKKSIIIKIKPIKNTYDNSEIKPKIKNKKNKYDDEDINEYIETEIETKIENTVTTITKTKTIKKKKNNLIISDEDYEKCIYQQVDIENIIPEEIIKSGFYSKLEEKKDTLLLDQNDQNYFDILNIKIYKKLMKNEEIKNAYENLLNALENIKICKKKDEKNAKIEVRKCKNILLKFIKTNNFKKINDLNNCDNESTKNDDLKSINSISTY
jgi:hypothetical protein